MASVLKLRSISPLEEEAPEDGNVDVIAELDDGRVYTFVVSTPKNLYWCMDNDGLDYFFGFPPVFVRLLTLDQIQRAIRAIVSEEDGRWLNTYGALQRAPEKEKKNDE